MHNLNKMQNKHLQFLAQQALVELCKLKLHNIKVKLECAINNSDFEFEITVLNEKHDNFTVHFYNSKKPTENHNALHQTFQALKTDDFEQIRQTLTTRELL